MEPGIPGSKPGWTVWSEAERLIPEAETTGRFGADVGPASADRRAVVRGDWKPSPTAVPVLASLERARARPTDEVGAPAKGRLAVLLTRAPVADPAAARAVGAPGAEALRLMAKPVGAVETGPSAAGPLARLGS